MNFFFNTGAMYGCVFLTKRYFTQDSDAVGKRTKHLHFLSALFFSNAFTGLLSSGKSACPVWNNNSNLSGAFCTQ